MKPLVPQVPVPNDRIQTFVVEGKMRGSISGTSEESTDRTPEVWRLEQAVQRGWRKWR